MSERRSLAHAYLPMEQSEPEDEGPVAAVAAFGEPLGQAACCRRARVYGCRLLLFLLACLGCGLALAMAAVAGLERFTDWRVEVEEVPWELEYCGVLAFALCSACLSLGLLRARSFAEQMNVLGQENGEYGHHNVKHALLLKKQEAAVRDMTQLAGRLEEVVPALAEDQRKVTFTMENVTEEIKKALDRTVQAWHEERAAKGRLRRELDQMQAIEGRLRSTVELLANGRILEEGLEHKMQDVLGKQQEVQKEAKRLQKERHRLQAEQQEMLKQHQAFLREQKQMGDTQKRATEHLESLKDHFLLGMNPMGMCVSSPSSVRSVTPYYL